MADAAVTSMSLVQVRELVNEKNIGDEVIEAVDLLLGGVLALAPLAAAPFVGIETASSLWHLIEPKDELFALLRAGIRKFSKSKPSDYLDRARRMSAANCMLVYTAYFDALRQQWPSIAAKLELSEDDAKAVLAQAIERGQGLGLPRISDRQVADYAVTIPYPEVPGISGVDSRRALYDQMTFGLDALLRASGESPLDLRLVPRLLRSKLPGLAESLYQAEYLGMMIDFEQFFRWNELRRQVATEGSLQVIQDRQVIMIERLGQLAEHHRAWFEHHAHAQHGLDVGLQELRKSIAALPPPAFTPNGVWIQQDIPQIAERLHTTYAGILREEIIDDQFEVGDDEASLSFPRKLTSFIPQAYRVARYDRKDLHLEREGEWRRRDVHDDIGEFVMRYLESPYGVEAPLLILGHPGSGKSLLTEVLAGHLTYPAYTTVRLKLRDYDRAKDLRTQLEKQIYKDTSGMDIRWAMFVDALRMTPPVVILDGYDELLQATGQEYARFLDEMCQFQHEQAQQGWPVRVIVTSRVTLIDKVRIPHGTTVVRLEEFDPGHRDAWVKVWNTHNEPYFRRAKVRPFQVPNDGKIVDLAKQPLLLLMLAIYDSARNELSSQPDIDQTLLYDRLLRRFIDRELSKGDAGREYRASPDTDKMKAVNVELERLGVVAIGMFNRQDVKIHRDELGADLRYFGAERSGLPSVHSLGQADRVLGGFFFIQESKSNFVPNEPVHSPGSAQAFEFLHNTFGEFLTADFILRRALDEARTISKLSGDDPDMLQMRGDKLSRPKEGWLGCLIHTPLHTRPVILTMLQEWSRHQLGDPKSREGLMSALDALVTAQLKLALNDLAIPNPNQPQRQLSPYVPLPARGQVATYSLNLIVLRTYLSDGDYTFKEAYLTYVGTDATACTPWDSLISLWRSWFPLDSLRTLADVIRTVRNHESIIVAPNGPSHHWGEGWLYDAHTVGMALADDRLAAVTGLHLAAVSRMTPEEFKIVRGHIAEQVPDLSRAADMLFRKTYVADGHDSSRLLEVPGPRGAFRPDLDDVTARLTHTPHQWLDVPVKESNIARVTHHSRYEAEAIIDAHAKLSPTLMPMIFSDGLTRDATRPPDMPLPDSWLRFLAGYAAAPMLRAAARELDPALCAAIAAWVAQATDGMQLDVPDADTASALATFAHRGGVATLRGQSLDMIIMRCEQGEWSLLDIPMETWEKLADIFVTEDPTIVARKPRLVALLEATITQSIENLGERAEERNRHARRLAFFWIQALRIGADSLRDKILHLASQGLHSEGGPWPLAGTDLQCLLALAGWAREVGDPSLAPLICFNHELISGFPSVLVQSARHVFPEAVDDPAVASLLTHKQAEDVRWLLTALQRQGQSPGESVGTTS